MLPDVVFWCLSLSSADFTLHTFRNIFEVVTLIRSHIFALIMQVLLVVKNIGRWKLANFIAVRSFRKILTIMLIKLSKHCFLRFFFANICVFKFSESFNYFFQTCPISRYANFRDNIRFYQPRGAIQIFRTRPGSALHLPWNSECVPYSGCRICITKTCFTQDAHSKDILQRKRQKVL